MFHRNTILLVGFLFVVITSVLAGDVNGKWTTTISTQIGDMPYTYTFKADGQQQEMGQNPNANLNQLKAMAIRYLVKKVFGTGIVAQIVSTVISSASSGGFSGGGGGSSGGSNMSLGLLNKLFSMVCR